VGDRIDPITGEPEVGGGGRVETAPIEVRGEDREEKDVAFPSDDRGREPEDKPTPPSLSPEEQQRDRAEREPYTPPAPSIERGITVSPTWKVADRTATGEPTTYIDTQGVRYYTPESTMWKLGYKTSVEYSQRQKGERVEVEEGKVEWLYTAPYVAVDTAEGSKHITREEAIGLSKLEGESLFNEQVELGLIPKGSVYIDESAYLTAKAAEVLKNTNPELYQTVITGDIAGYQRYIEFAETQAKQLVDWFTSEAPVELKQAYERGGLGEALKLYTQLRDKELQTFESELQNASPELFTAYKAGGLEAYNALAKQLNKEYEEFKQQLDSGEVIELPDGKYISKEDFDKQPEGVQQVMRESGIAGVESLGETTWLYKGNVISSTERQRIIDEFEAKRETLIKEGKQHTKEWEELPEHPIDTMVLTPESGKRLGIKTISFIVPAAKALLPEYTVKDVSAVEWGLTVVNLALIGAAFAPGAVLGSIVGRVATRSLTTAGAGLVGYQTTKHWNKLSPVEKALGAGGTLLYALPVLSIPVRNIKITTTKIPTIEGEVVAWKGLSVFQNPIIGRSGGKWVVGARNLTLPEAKLILDGYKPEMMLDTKVFVNEQALIKAGIAKEQIDFLSLTLKNRNLFAGKKSPFLSEETLFDPTARLDADEVAVFLEQMAKYRDKVTHVDLFGSQSIKAQLAPELRGWRKTHDLDMQSTFSLDEAIAFTNETLEKLRKLGGNRQYRLSPKSPIRIEKIVKGKWEHINDLKSEFIDPALQTSELPGSQLDKTNIYSYGRLVEEPLITVEYPGVGRIDIMRLSESGIRKSDTILRVRQTGTGTAFRPPERGIASPGVPKDAADFYVILRTFKGQKLADEWAEAWAVAMGYAKSEAKRLLPKITKAMEKVASETPSDLIGYRIYPEKVEVGADVSPTFRLHVPSSLVVSVSGKLASKIVSPVSPYAIASNIPSAYLPSVAGMSATSFTTPVGVSAIGATPPLGVSTIPSAEISPAPSTAPSAISEVSPVSVVSPSLSPDVSPSPVVSAVPVSGLITPSPDISTSPSPVTSISIEKEPIPKPSPKPPPLRDDENYQKQVDKIVPGTVVWIQGRPTGGAMFRLLPPPYTDEDGFTMRVPPPDYIDEGLSGKGSAFKSVQVIGGLPPENIENVDLGIMKININVESGKPVISYAQDVEANVGAREETIGMGEGQIPIEVWKEAKAEGVSVEELRATRDVAGEGLVQDRLVPIGQELQVSELLPDISVEEEAQSPILDLVEDETSLTPDMEQKPEAEIVWVDSWKEFPREDKDSTIKAYYDHEENKIYAITNVTTKAEIEHEKYHSTENSEGLAEAPSDFVKSELAAHKYAYEKIGAPKGIIEKLRGIYNEMRTNYDVDPHEAWAMLERELERINPPESWKADIDRLRMEYQAKFGRVKEDTLVTEESLLLPEGKRLIGGDNRLVSGAIALETSDEEDEEDDRKRRRKPKNLKDWWDSPYYASDNGNSIENKAQRIPERTYYGHKLLPPDLGGTL